MFFGIIIDILILLCIWPLSKWDLASNYVLSVINSTIPNTIDEYFFIFINIASLFLILVFFAAIFSTLISEILVRIMPVNLRPKISEIYKLKILQQEHKKPIWLLISLENGDRYLGVISSMQPLENEFGEMELTLEGAYCERSSREERENIGNVTLLSKNIQAIRIYEK